MTNTKKSIIEALKIIKAFNENYPLKKWKTIFTSEVTEYSKNKYFFYPIKNSNISSVTLHINNKKNQYLVIAITNINITKAKSILENYFKKKKAILEELNLKEYYFNKTKLIRWSISKGSKDLGYRNILTISIE